MSDGPDDPFTGVVRAPRRDNRTALLDVAGIRITRIAHDTLIASIAERISSRYWGDDIPPLAIGSVNLDHVYHFAACADTAHRFTGAVQWQLLVDGSPISRHARTVTGQAWPRLAGSDLLPDMLDLAAATGARVGFLGGTEPTARALQARLERDWPTLRLAGIWTPPRAVLDDADSAGALADRIRAADVDLLVVGLGKPRQEVWTDEYSVRAGAAVYAMFGAAADFLAGTSRRAPAWMCRAGIEWLYRLVTEPRRLWRRYLVQGPRAMRALRRGGATVVYPPELLTSSAARQRDLAS